MKGVAYARNTAVPSLRHYFASHRFTSRARCSGMRIWAASLATATLSSTAWPVSVWNSAHRPLWFHLRIPNARSDHSAIQPAPNTSSRRIAESCVTINIIVIIMKLWNCRFSVIKSKEVVPLWIERREEVEARATSGSTVPAIEPAIHRSFP